MPDKHALLSASSAERWIRCPGSVKACMGKPNPQTQYSAAGTLAHELGEAKLLRLYKKETRMTDTQYLYRMSEIKDNPLYEKEMDACTDEYVQTVQDITNARPDQPSIMIEQRVSFDEYAPGGFGTADCLIVYPDTLHVVDYKHGQGVPVSAEDNPQLKLYALGALRNLAAYYPDLVHVVLHIVQPRAGGVSQWETTAEDLKHWGRETVLPAAELALSDDAPMHPGEKQCRFCLIRGNCRARAEMVSRITQEPWYGKPPAELRADELGAALSRAKDVEDWLAKVQDHVFGLLQSGEQVPGYKLVAGRTSRKWRDQQAAFDALRSAGIPDDLLYERTPLTVPKMEKALGKALYESQILPWVDIQPGKPTLVSDTDPRPTWSQADSDFAGILQRASK